MKKTIGGLLVYSAGLVNILTGGGNVNATAVDRGSGAMYEITDDKSPTEVPLVEPWAAGKLDDSARTFDLVVTGNCAAGGDLKLDIKPGATRPDFFYTDKGKLLYAEPQPMAAVTMPKGHSASVMISLSNINHKTEMTDKVKDYICLGIKKKGVISGEVLYGDTTHASTLINMDSEDVVELVPLLSTTALSAGGYTRAVPGSEAALVSGSIDFSSVYRVDIQAFSPDTPMDVEWEGNKLKSCGLADCEGFNINNGYSIGVGPVKADRAHEKQLLAVDYYGNLAYSSDGITWNPCGSIVNEGENCNSEWNRSYRTIVYGNGMWCVAGGKGIKYLRDNEDKWSDLDTQVTNIYSLAFDNFTFIADSTSSIYTLSKDETEWKPLPKTDHYYTPFVYHNNTWMAFSYNIITYEYDSANAEWKEFSAAYPSSWGQSGEWTNVIYTHGYFYRIYNAGDDGLDQVIARSSNGREWDCFESSFGGSVGCGDIVVYNDKLYVFSYDGTHFIVGEFLPKPTE